MQVQGFLFSCVNPLKKCGQCISNEHGLCWNYATLINKIHASKNSVHKKQLLNKLIFSFVSSMDSYSNLIQTSVESVLKAGKVREHYAKKLHVTFPQNHCVLSPSTIPPRPLCLLRLPSTYPRTIVTFPTP